MFKSLRQLLMQRRTLVVLGVVVLLWVLFVDSHSVLNRVRWHREAERLRVENQKMEAVISQTTQELSRRDDKEEIERIAREAYGLRRDGETVYRVEVESE